MNLKINKKIIRGIIVYLLFQFYSLSKYIPLLLFNLNRNHFKNNYHAECFLIIFTSLILLFLLLIIYRKDLIDEWKIFKKKTNEKLDIGLSYWAIGLIIMIVSNTLLNYIFKIGGAKNENLIQTYIAASPWLIGFDICILAPINEELVFRKATKDIFNHPKLYIFASFLIFGAAHIINVATSWTDWLYIIPYGALGAAFASTYQKTESIYTSMFYHMMHNILLFLLSVMIK